jgi:peptidoglycan/xylan/chitin deacetylase (PgdA/CDA1 family)/LysM repeat protein
MLFAALPILLAAAVSAAPFERRGLAQIKSNCAHDVSYSFDDGPYIYHNEILDAFDSHTNAKASFFINGNNYGCIYDTANVAAIRRSYEEGHLIASHTWSHAALDTLTHAQIDYEIQRLDEALVKIIGVKPKFLRPPYGSINEDAATYIQNTYGKTIVLWSDDSGDSTGGSAQQSYDMYNGFANAANAGNRSPHMALSHETQEAAIQAIRMGSVTRLANAGINLQTVAKCTDDESPYFPVGGYGTRDSTWTCTGTFTPTTPTNPNNPTCASRYTSVAGDNCVNIGAKYGLTGAQISAANSFVNCNDIWVGTNLCIPPGGTPPTSTTSATQPAPTCVSRYTSVAGDNCVNIGAKYGLSGAQISAANSFVNCNDIWVGTNLCIPPGGTGPTSSTTSSSTPAPTCVSRYTSVAGDNCVNIGAKYGLSGAQISAANSFVNCNDIWVGTNLCIPPGGTGPTSTTSSTPPAPTCVSTYTSVAGDNCASIGTKFGLTGNQILAANTFLNCNDIWTNTSICIPPGGSSSTTCTLTISSTAGATCDSIGAQYGVSGAQIKTWNDFLTCNDIWANTPVCVRH